MGWSKVGWGEIGIRKMRQRIEDMMKTARRGEEREGRMHDTVREVRGSRMEEVASYVLRIESDGGYRNKEFLIKNLVTEGNRGRV